MLKKQQNQLNGKAFHLRHVQDHPIHNEHKAAVNKLKDVMKETHNQDWTNWLEATSKQDLYITNKYIPGDPMDYSNAQGPTLHTTTNNLSSSTESNTDKAAALAGSFFPLLPAST